MLTVKILKKIQVEFNFPEKGSEENVWYDITLVNGYSLPVSVVPNVQVGLKYYFKADYDNFYTILCSWNMVESSILV